LFRRGRRRSDERGGEGEGGEEVERVGEKEGWDRKAEHERRKERRGREKGELKLAHSLSSHEADAIGGTKLENESMKCRRQRRTCRDAS